MATKRSRIPRYGTVEIKGHTYYKTYVMDADGKQVALYEKTREALYDKELAALEQIDNATFRRKSPTVKEYCEKWLLMQSVHVRATTLTDYTSKVRRHIISFLGDMRMGDVTLDDIQIALVPVSKKSASVYKSVVILYKSIFRAAMDRAYSVFYISFVLIHLRLMARSLVHQGGNRDCGCISQKSPAWDVNSQNASKGLWSVMTAGFVQAEAS